MNALIKRIFLAGSSWAGAGMLLLAAVLFCNNSRAQTGASMSSPIQAGTFSNSGIFGHSMSNASAGLGNYIGQSSNEIYYRFNLNGAATVKLSHCGSGFDTYMWLLNSNGTEITHNDDNSSASSPCPGTQAYIETTLSAGTYYVVSEGYSSNTGIIVTNITVTMTSAVTLSYPTVPSNFMAGVAIAPIVPTLSGSPTFDRQITSTMAGSGTEGFLDGPGVSAQFNWPLDVDVDALGNLYVPDSRNQRIRRISPSGVVSTYAGNGSQGSTDGSALSASFSNPTALAVDASGNVYVCDQQNHKIRKITPSGIVSTVAGSGVAGFANGTGTAAQFNGPAGICVDASGNLYVGDAGNQRIRKVTPSGVVSTYAGTGAAGATNGAATSATFRTPRGVILDAAGNLIVCDRANFMLRKITPSGVVSTLAGSGVAGYVDGSATTARFGSPNSVDIDEAGVIYVGDQNGNHMIRKITPDGTVSTLAGSTTLGSTDGGGSAVLFYNIYGICFAPGGFLYVADTYNDKIRKVRLTPFSISPQLPSGLVFSTTNGTISGTPLAVSPATVYTINAYSAPTVGITFAVTGTPASPSQDQNYIITYSPRKAYFTTSEGMIASGGSPGMVQTTVQYFDGLGRPWQTVQVKGSPGADKDIVQPVVYDAFGRQGKQYLPYASTSANGSYKTDALSAQGAYFASPPAGVVLTPTPFSHTVFESSPLNRVNEQGAPGNSWQPAISGIPGSGHTVRQEYGANADAGDRSVRLYVAAVTATEERSLSSTGHYEANQLYLTITKDENWSNGKGGTTEEYKNKEGRVVLKRIWQDENIKLSTYYVYDDFGNLSFVLPPGATPDGAVSGSNTIAQTVLDNMCYQYRYDGRQRLIEKKLPGKGWEYMVYNKLDQVILTQDARQQSSGIWLFSKYDALGRVACTGEYNSATVRSTLQALVNNETNLWETFTNATNAVGYNNISFPQSYGTLYTINYYDRYDFLSNTTVNPDLATYTAPSIAVDSIYQAPMGLQTGSKVKVLGTSSFLMSVTQYNKEGKPVKIQSQHYKGGTASVTQFDVTENQYSFTGEVVRSTRSHYAGSTTNPVLTIVNRYSYDHIGRKIKTYEQINSDAEMLLSSSDYNEAGQLKTKGLLNNQQITGYTYNERGWLKSSSSSAFSMQLNYQDGTVPQWNGNISNQSWGASLPNANTFTYQYDKLNRLLSGAASGMSENISYDAMGNIISMSRDGGTAGAYTYSGNQLSKISGGPLATNTYTYDSNGNTTTDGRNNKTITYNVLNLPAIVSGGVTYTYDATGNKLRKVVGTVTTDYINGIEYQDNLITIIHTEEGIARRNGSTYNYEFNLADHLGNVRYSFYKNPSSGQLERLQSDDYYPFGLRRSVSPVSLNNKYLYNGKELQEELGQYDYGARFYDPVIARWSVIDPMTEKYYGITPYSYTINNPSSLIDRDGRDVDISTLTDEEQKKALVEYLKTKKGQALVASFLKKGQSLTVKVGKRSHVYTTEKDGEFGNDVLSFGSADWLGKNGNKILVGRTITSKPDGNELDQDGMGGNDFSYDVRGKIKEQIWLLTGESVDENISNMGHESFVHSLPDMNRLRELRQELNNGTIKPGTKAYEIRLKLITQSADVDHKNLSTGGATTYKNFSQQMDAVKSTSRYIKAYNDDVKEHK